MDMRQTTVRFRLTLAGDHLRGNASGLPPNPAVEAAVDVGLQPAPTLDSLLEHFVGNILIARDGQVIAAHSYGFASLEWHIANTAATRFHIGSLTKQFTAVSILLLAEKGKLRLDDPISKYVDDTPPHGRT